MPDCTPLTGADFDRPQRLVIGLGAVVDLVDAASDMQGVRPENLAVLLSLMVEPLQQDLDALVDRVSAKAGPPQSG